ncbi:MAG: glycosyltransferase 87 family protein [Chloroflexota bacterium]
MKNIKSKWPTVGPWVIFAVWGLLIFVGLIDTVSNGQVPVDYRSYQRAADLIDEGLSPYSSLDESRANWLELHEYVVRQYSDREAFNPLLEPPAGPYVYPPTLALFIQQTNTNAIAFGFVLLASVFGFAWLWIRENQPRKNWWILFVILSFDTAGFIISSNIELILVFLALFAGWLIWHNRPVWAGLLIAITFLIKPFFGLFFAAFCLIMIAISLDEWRARLQTSATAAVTSFVFIFLDIARWPVMLRQEALTYFQNGLAHQWFVLPVEQQIPMSLWNRSLLQVFVNFGVEATAAQTIGLVVWVLILGCTIWSIWALKLNFYQAFALAYIVFLIGRPVNWTLPYVEFVVVLAVWPQLKETWQKRAVLGAGIFMTLSHWIASSLAASGISPALVTLQTINFPWEILILLPLFLCLIIWSVRQY